MAVPYGLGDLKAIELWHNNTGETPGWFHMETAVSILFIYLNLIFFIIDNLVLRQPAVSECLGPR